MGRYLGVNDVADAVAEITKQTEKHNGALSALVGTGNKYEGWWQGVLVAGFALPPWSRTPGWDASDESAAGLSAECTYDFADCRLVYTRRTKKYEKRIDLVVRAGGGESRVHLIELKWIDGSWSHADQVPGIKKSGVARDAEALRQMAGWDDVASGWSIVLATHFDDEDTVREWLDGVGGHHRKGRMVVVEVPLRAGDSAWVVGIRMA
jgi:hypothetical protein